MTAARSVDLAAGEAVGAEIERQFADPRVSYIHLHNAKPGCFSCLVRRAREGARDERFGMR